MTSTKYTTKHELHDAVMSRHTSAVSYALSRMGEDSLDIAQRVIDAWSEPHVDLAHEAAWSAMLGETLDERIVREAYALMRDTVLHHWMQRMTQDQVESIAAALEMLDGDTAAITYLPGESLTARMLRKEWQRAHGVQEEEP